jgi:type II secretory pathway pseudopilin PulG
MTNHRGGKNIAYAIIICMKVQSRNGYTILEVLIFVAVSSMMFVAALTAIGGRQQQVQFAQATREFDAKLRDIINDITTGYFPTNPTINCNVIAGEVQIAISTDEDLGTNDTCVYVGKALQFQPEGNPNIMRVYPLAGKRYSDLKLTPSVSIAESKPKAVVLLSNATFKDQVENYNLLYGLKVTRVIRQISPSVETDYGVVGILSNFGGSSVSESQSVQVGGVFGSSLGLDKSSAVAIINTLSDDVARTGSSGFIEKNTNEGVTICLESPEGKKASVTFGIKGSSTTELKLDNYEKGCD